MRKLGRHKSALEKIRDSQDFSELAPYCDSNKWGGMSLEERELLALLFVMEGEQQLVEGNSNVLECFKRANEVAPDSPKILYRQALSFAKQTQNTFCLRAACEVFEKVVDVESDSFEAWHGWAKTLGILGASSNEMTRLQEALNKFSYAEQLSSKTSREALASFFRDWGGCWYSQGELSGEACDFRDSIKMFRRAAEFGYDTHKFWNDYGTAYVELSHLVNKPTLLNEGVDCYWKALKQAPDYYEGWVNMATALHSLYRIHPHETYFTLANEGFDRAAKIDPQQGNLWLQWGRLLAFKGKITKDLERLKDSCKKFEIADICDPNHHLIFSSWSEALMLIGALTEDVSLLHKSLDLVAKSLEIQPESPFAWCQYGNCLNEFGRYFSDENYYLDAIDKFRYGLKLDAEDFLLWHGLSLAIFYTGQMRDELELMEDSTKFCVKVIECGGHASPGFWNDWGVILMKIFNITDEKRHVEGALKKFEQAIRLRTEFSIPELVDPEWLYNYGCALELLGDIDEDVSSLEKGVQVLKQVLCLNPDFIPAYLNLATAYSHLGELTTDLDYFRESIKQFENYLTLDMEDDFAWSEWGVTFLNLALLVKDPSRPDDAAHFFREAENKFMHAVALGNTPAMYYLACLHSLTGNDSAAIHFLERAEEHQVLPCIEDLLQDEWLEGVRQNPDFRHFLSHLQRKQSS